MSEKKQKAILLLAFGGADSLEDVEPFIKNVIAPREPSPELISDAKMRYTHDRRKLSASAYYKGAGPGA